MHTPDEKRYDSMVYNRCGQSGLILPAISFGLWHNFGDKAERESMVKLLTTAFDNGITHFDLANNYGPVYGAAEENFGEILKKEFCSYRDELVVSTKAGFDMWPGPYGNFGSRKYLVASLDQSLRRMKLDYVDIFYHHRPDPNTPLEETCGALDFLVKQGKALYVGVSNYNKEQTEAAIKCFKRMGTPFVVNQSGYSLFNRKIERNGLKAYAKNKGMGLVTFCPLQQGLLSGKYMEEIPKDSRIVTDGRYLHAEDATNAQTLQKLRKLNEIAGERGQSLAQMAISWILRDGDITSVLIGASKPAQILENLGALKNVVFSEEERGLIDEITRV